MAVMTGDDVKHHLKLNFGFSDSSPDRRRAIEELRRFLGAERRGEWFVSLLEYLGAFRNRYKVSDLHLIEGRPPYASKPLTPLFVPALQKKGVPSRIEQYDLLALGKAFLGVKKDAELFERIAKEEGGVNFSFAVYGLGVFRCNLSLFQEGLSLTVRWLDFVIPDLDALAYPPVYGNFIRRLTATLPAKYPLASREEAVEIGVLKRGGLILHCGATGSGKTTSIAAEIDRLAMELNGVIITYENPVEYRYYLTKAPVIQYDVNFSFGGDWTAVLKHLLRNTPSVALIGEVRSSDEIEALIDIASRGHLIFSTMHAGSVAEALEVLFSTGVPGSQLASALLAVVAHRLTVERDEKGEVFIRPFYEYLIVHPEGIISDRPEHGLLSSLQEKNSKKISQMLGELQSKGSKIYMSFDQYGYRKPRTETVELSTEEIKRLLVLVKNLSLGAPDFRTAVSVALSHATSEEKKAIKRLIDFFRLVLSGLVKVPYSIEELYQRI